MLTLILMQEIGSINSPLDFWLYMHSVLKSDQDAYIYNSQFDIPRHLLHQKTFCCNLCFITITSLDLDVHTVGISHDAVRYLIYVVELAYHETKHLMCFIFLLSILSLNLLPCSDSEPSAGLVYHTHSRCLELICIKLPIHKALTVTRVASSSFELFKFVRCELALYILANI